MEISPMEKVVLDYNIYEIPVHHGNLFKCNATAI